MLETAAPDEGDVVYTVHQGTEDPTSFLLYEDWTSRVALDKHLTSPELQEARGALAPLVAGPPMLVRLRRVT